MKLLRSSFGRLFSSKSANRDQARPRHQRHRFGPIEALEARELLSTIPVISTADSGAGSLRQAILDANSNAGPDSIEFNIPVTDPNFVRPNGTDCDSTHNGIPDSSPCWWRITLASPLPVLTDDNTQIRGATQPGNTNPGLIGTAFLVGVDAVPLALRQAPEIAIDGNGLDAITISGNATGIVIDAMSIYGAARAIVVNAGSASHSVATLSNVVVGALPDGSDPGADRNSNNGIEVGDLAQVTITSSTIAFNGQSGIFGSPNGSVLNATFNEVFSNGWNSNSHSGIDVRGIDSQIRLNAIYGNTNAAGAPRSDSGHGIQLGPQLAGTGHILVENNLIAGNQSAGLSIRGGSSNNTIRKNVLTGNALGVAIARETSTQTNNNLIVENRIGGNGHGPNQDGLGIDLVAASAGATLGDGVTLNDAGDADAGSNNLVNFPVLADAKISGSSLILSGFSEPGAVIDFYIALPDGSGFGEGQTFVISRTEGAANDSDTSTGVYGPSVNGHTVVAGPIAGNRFRYEFSLATLGTTVSVGTVLTTTGTVAGNTSEFGPNVTVSLDLGSLSGSVYQDTDDDGVRDGSESGISNVLITLTGTDDLGAAVNRTTHTNNSGNYAFDSLRPGVYQIAETQPAGFADGKDTVGTLAGDKQNDRFFNILVLTGQHGTDYNFGELPTLPPFTEDHTFSIFPGTEQLVTVRLLSRPGFDPRDVDQDTVRLGNAIVRKFRSGGDVNKDGRRDVLLFFKAKETDLKVGDQTVRLHGQFRDGRPFAVDLNIQTLAFGDVRISRHLHLHLHRG